MKAQISVVRGNDADKIVPLDASIENCIGRGSDCTVCLTDPLSSRVHAKVVYVDAKWLLRDCGSRNGTLVNGSKVDEVTLATADRIRIGNTELTFTDLSEADAPTQDAERLTQTLVQNASMGPSHSAVSALYALHDKKRRQDLLDLYQLSFRLLSVENVSEIVEMGLAVLMARTRANVVGLLWADSDGKLRPQLVVPAEKEGQIRLSQQLTTMVLRESKAIWFKNENTPVDGPLQRLADAICVPLLQDGKAIGAIHAYREDEKFEEHDFDFAMSAGSILSAALIRAQTQVAFQSHHDLVAAKNAVFDDMIGKSKPMLELKERIARVATASGCVLIRGESGSGKELVARAIHRQSPRRTRPLLCVNCAAIPAELMESQLFGHKKGAFTGADKDHVGWFQQADTGTLFLDEIGELTLEGQAKLLRVLEGYSFLPVGSNREVRVDVRVVAATNRDLKELVREKRFREDLFYRLGVFELWIPPLRERNTDIELLVDTFLEHFRHQRGRHQLCMSPAARKKLLEYHWPGNVRQMRNVIDSAVVLAIGNEILPGDLGLHDVSEGVLDTLKIDEWEKRLIQEALKRTRDSMPEAADLLGISRATLYRKIETYGIDRKI